MKKRYKKFFSETIIKSFKDYSSYDPERAEMIKGSFLDI
jgi:hypothetical protein